MNTYKLLLATEDGPQSITRPFESDFHASLCADTLAALCDAKVIMVKNTKTDEIISHHSDRNRECQS